MKITKQENGKIRIQSTGEDASFEGIMLAYGYIAEVYMYKIKKLNEEYESLIQELDKLNDFEK